MKDRKDTRLKYISSDEVKDLYNKMLKIIDDCENHYLKQAKSKIPAPIRKVTSEIKNSARIIILPDDDDVALIELKMKDLLANSTVEYNVLKGFYDEIENEKERVIQKYSENAANAFTSNNSIDDAFMLATKDDQKEEWESDEFLLYESEDLDEDSEQQASTSDEANVDEIELSLIAPTPASPKEKMYSPEELLREIEDNEMHPLKNLLSILEEDEDQKVILKAIESRFTELSALAVNALIYLDVAQQSNSETYALLHALELLDLKMRNILFSLDIVKGSYMSPRYMDFVTNTLVDKLYTEENIARISVDQKNYLLSLQESLHLYVGDQEISRNVSASAKAKIIGLGEVKYSEKMHAEALDDSILPIFSNLVNVVQRFSLAAASEIKDKKLPLIDKKHIANYLSLRYGDPEKSLAKKALGFFRDPRAEDEVRRFLKDTERQISQEFDSLKKRAGAVDRTLKKPEKEPVAINWMDSSPTLEDNYADLHDKNNVKNMQAIGDKEEELLEFDDDLDNDVTDKNKRESVHIKPMLKS